MNHKHEPEYKGENFETIEEERRYFKVEMRRQKKLTHAYRKAMYDVRNLLLPHVKIRHDWHGGSSDMITFGSPIERAERAIKRAKDSSDNIKTIRTSTAPKPSRLRKFGNWLHNMNLNP